MSQEERKTVLFGNECDSEKVALAGLGLVVTGLAICKGSVAAGLAVITIGLEIARRGANGLHEERDWACSSSTDFQDSTL